MKLHQIYKNRYDKPSPEEILPFLGKGGIFISEGARVDESSSILRYVDNLLNSRGAVKGKDYMVIASLCFPSIPYIEEIKSLGTTMDMVLVTLITTSSWISDDDLDKEYIKEIIRSEL